MFLGLVKRRFSAPACTTRGVTHSATLDLAGCLALLNLEWPLWVASRAGHRLAVYEWRRCLALACPSPLHKTRPRQVVADGFAASPEMLGIERLFHRQE